MATIAEGIPEPVERFRLGSHLEEEAAAEVDPRIQASVVVEAEEHHQTQS